MASPLQVTVPEGVIDALLNLVREAVADEIATRLTGQQTGFLDVDGAAAYLSSTSTAIRSLVKRDAIPHHKAPNGRLLFDRDELDAWVRTG